MKFSKRVQFFFTDAKEWFRTKIGAWCFVLAFFFLALDIALPIWRIVPLAESRPYIPLHYNIYLGVDRLGSWYQIFVIPAIGLGLFLFHLVLQTIAFRKEKLLAVMVAIATVVLEFLLLVAMALIVLLNLSYAA
jgi:hypothetical protein